MNRLNEKVVGITGILLIIASCYLGDNELSDSGKKTSSYTEEANTNLWKDIQQMDSLVFNRAFNHCELYRLDNLLHQDFEFYHDEAGITDSFTAFRKSMEGLCKMEYRASRQLDFESMQVYPLYNQGQLYGALQEGTHQFYATEKNGHTYKTSAARFVHLWILEEKKWRLKRVFSFNHQRVD